MLRQQSSEIASQAASSTVSIEKLQAAFNNIYATIDTIDTFKLAALDSMRRTIDSLTHEVARAQEYDALLIPGGLANPDELRSTPGALEFTQHFLDWGKPIAAICHAPWVLIDADGVAGTRLTSWHAIQTDVRNAAIRAGTIPQISLETGQEEVGKMGTAELVALTERVRKAGGKVQLTAVAAESVTAADPLTFAVLLDAGPKNLRFEIKRISDRP